MNTFWHGRGAGFKVGGGGWLKRTYQLYAEDEENVYAVTGHATLEKFGICKAVKHYFMHFQQRFNQKLLSQTTIFSVFHHSI